MKSINTYHYVSEPTAALPVVEDKTSNFPVHVTITIDQAETIFGIDKLESLILEIFDYSPKFGPSIVTLYTAISQAIYFGISDESFVQVGNFSGEPHSLISLGDPNRLGTKTFFLHGNHHTEIPIKNLIPFIVARRVVSKFLVDGEYSQEVSWEEVC